MFHSGCLGTQKQEKKKKKKKERTDGHGSSQSTATVEEKMTRTAKSSAFQA